MACVCDALEHVLLAAHIDGLAGINSRGACVSQLRVGSKVASQGHK